VNVGLGDICVSVRFQHSTVVTGCVSLAGGSGGEGEGACEGGWEGGIVRGRTRTQTRMLVAGGMGGGAEAKVR